LAGHQAGGWGLGTGMCLQSLLLLVLGRLQAGALLRTLLLAVALHLLVLPHRVQHLGSVLQEKWRETGQHSISRVVSTSTVGQLVAEAGIISKMRARLAVTCRQKSFLARRSCLCCCCCAGMGSCRTAYSQSAAAQDSLTPCCVAELDSPPQTRNCGIQTCFRAAAAGPPAACQLAE
jgi:hypothetical protein